MKVAVVGSGYVGLVAGACFANAGNQVVCVDVDEAKLKRLEAGQVPFFEPGLEDMVERNWPKRLQFSSDLSAAVEGASVAIIAVGTPPQEDGSADLSYVLGVARDVARLAKEPLVLVTKSTVPVGTNAKVRAVVAEEGNDKISVVSNPEFLKEGDAINDFLKPDRVVIGTDDDRAFDVMSRLYAPFCLQRKNLIRMTPQSAEIVKYAANAMLATKISFMNEIARLCDAAGADVEDVRMGVGSDNRIGYKFLYPGLGFGGSCFPKDLRALVSTGEELGTHMSVAAAATNANVAPVNDMLAHMDKDLGGLSGKRIAVWGLAFKPRTDDVREAAALRLIQGLVKAGATVAATDPEAMVTGKTGLEFMGVTDGVDLIADQYDAVKGADALVIATEWSEYRAPDGPRLKELMRGSHVFDGRNCVAPRTVTDCGFHYRGVGRPPFEPTN